MINFQDELQKFKPQMTTVQAEEISQDEEVQDLLELVQDLLKKVSKEI